MLQLRSDMPFRHLAGPTWCSRNRASSRACGAGWRLEDTLCRWPWAAGPPAGRAGRRRAQRRGSWHHLTPRILLTSLCLCCSCVHDELFTPAWQRIIKSVQMHVAASARAQTHARTHPIWGTGQDRDQASNPTVRGWGETKCGVGCAPQLGNERSGEGWREPKLLCAQPALALAWQAVGDWQAPCVAAALWRARIIEGARAQADQQMAGLPPEQQL